MAAWPEGGTAAGPGGLRASDADREQVVDALKTAFAWGRLTKNEFDAGVGRALTSRTYAELAVVAADIRAARPAAQSCRRDRTVSAGQMARRHSLARTLRTRQWPWVLVAGLVLVLLGVTLVPSDTDGGHFGNTVVFLGLMLVLQAAARGVVKLPSDQDLGPRPPTPRWSTAGRRSADR